jgi:hypothetical protein
LAGKLETFPADVYLKQHAELISSDGWIIDDLGQQASIPDRLSRATEIILIDLPLWMHFWLAEVRAIRFVICCRLPHVPAKWNPVRRQGHAPPPESTALPGHIGSLSDPI